MFVNIFEMFSFAFMVRAIIVGVLISLSASLLGVSLVLKRYSMIGDGLSHVGFAALALATVFNAAPLQFAIPIVVVSAFFLLKITQKTNINGDAAIAIFSSSSIAIGVILISKSTGMNTDVCNYMFGSILSMSKSDLYLSICVSILVIVLFVIFYNKLFAVTFDEDFAKATGLNTEAYNSLLAVLSALVIVLGMRMMGALLISSLIIFPALTSMRTFKSFRVVTICSAILGVMNFLIGIYISYVENLPTGASVVVVNLILFVLFSVIGILRNRRKI